MKLTWTQTRDRGTPAWRLDDEHGAIVAEVTKTPGRPYGNPWLGRCAVRLTNRPHAPYVARRHAEHARYGVQDIVRANARAWFECEDVEFILREK